MISYSAWSLHVAFTSPNARKQHCLFVSSRLALPQTHPHLLLCSCLLSPSSAIPLFTLSVESPNSYLCNFLRTVSPFNPKVLIAFTCSLILNDKPPQYSQDMQEHSQPYLLKCEAQACGCNDVPCGHGAGTKKGLYRAICDVCDSP